MSVVEQHVAGIEELDIHERWVSITAASWLTIINDVNTADIENLRNMTRENIFARREKDSIRILRDRLEGEKEKIGRRKKMNRHFELGVAPFEHEIIVSVLAGSEGKVDNFNPYENSAQTQEESLVLGEYVQAYNFGDRFVKRAMTKEERIGNHG